MPAAQRRSRKLFAIPATERVEARVIKTGYCWEWQGAPTSSGYGQIYYQGKPHYAHRLAYEAYKGPIPKGMSIDHTCHNKMCANPDHLRVVTQGQNVENHQGAYKTSKTGVRGVYLTVNGKYAAQVRHKGKRINVGNFASLADAERAVIEARNSLHTHNDIDRMDAIKASESR